ncbi:hypothetical protein PVAP13_9NG651901 [Panicum virgatum]|uniref:Secreted protein n=1 Tax=Panicum virgatum TaxID=38727 RepID=A0A8T0MYS9_PANVG|nr:hypothetical protein PVAP13_9NG651901 [Panicum virgatum]
MCMICSFLLVVCMFVPSSSLLFRARPALVLSGGVVVRRVHSSGTSAPSMLSLLMVPVNHMPGGVSTASAIPLQGFLPLDGWRWMVVCGAWRSCRCHHQLQGMSSYPVSCGLCTLRRL